VALFETTRFQLAISAASRALLLRDRLFPSYRPSPLPLASEPQPRHLFVRSQDRILNASLLCPATLPHSSVLILHGIGERIAYWHRAQHLLAQHGIASLVFQYSGYPGSTGSPTLAHLHNDTLAAYAALRDLVPLRQPPFLLGLSLGTGVAVEAAHSLVPAASGFILCQPFTSLREAAARLFHSKLVAQAVPDLYRTRETIAELHAPLLLVHGDADTLFPVDMSRQILTSALAHSRRAAQLAVPSGHAHNDAFQNPTLSYWQPILDFIRTCHPPNAEDDTPIRTVDR